MAPISGLLPRRYGWRPFRALAGVLLGALILAGCGGTTTSRTSGPSHEPTTAPTAYHLPENPQNPSQRETELWRHNVLVVGVITSGSLPIDLAQQVANVINDTLKEHAKPALTAGLDDPTDPDDGDGPGVAQAHAFGKAAVITLRILGGPAGKDAVLEASDQINYQAAVQNGIPLPGDSQTRILGASPNWLVTPLGGSTQAGGSPGGSPTWPSAGGTAIHNSPTGTAGQGKTVYILDTADPVASSPATLPDGLQTTCPASAALCGGMLSDLSAGGGTIDETTQTFSAGLQNVSGTYGTDPSIREHGLFITAMIHHVAPGANIHLIQVLNNYGVGDMNTVLNGLAAVYDAAQAGNASQIVLNLSLEMQPPFACMFSLWQQSASGGGEQWDTPPYYDTSTRLHHFGRDQVRACAGNNASQVVSKDQSYRLNTLLPLGIVLQQLTTMGVTVVAAAGNDSTTGGQLGDGLPAAYCGVKAVAASQDPVGAGWMYPGTPPPPLAPFSNAPSLNGQCVQVQAAVPLPSSTVTLTSRAPQDALQADGVNICSLYLGPNTDAPTAPAGVVQWSGTSFATALVSGNYASGTLPGSGGSITLDESQPCTPSSSA